jgi:hypothetical protein
MHGGICLLVQEIVQLAGTYPGLASPHITNKFQHLLILDPTRSLGLASLVIRLSADAQIQASPTDAQAGYLLLREDLPDRFFTRDTP